MKLFPCLPSYFCLAFHAPEGQVKKEDTSLPQTDVIQEGPVVIDLNAPELEKEVFKLSDMASEIAYVALETNEDYLVKNIKALELAGRHIYASTPDQLLLFDAYGYFVRRTGSAGNGPGEYNVIADIAVDNDDYSVYLINILGKKIMHYSLGGEFLDSFSTGFNSVPDNIELYGGNIYLSFSDIINNTGVENIRLVVAALNRSGGYY